MVDIKPSLYAKDLNKAVLIGFMGSGKSTVGNTLAHHTSSVAFDSDKLIKEKFSQFANISELVREWGIAKFRELEIELAKSFLPLMNEPSSKRFVISLGGGAVTQSRTMNPFSSAAIIFLDTPFDLVKSRALRETRDRPLFKDVDSAHALYKERKPLYNAYCDIKISNSNGRKISDIVEQLRSVLGW